MPEHIRRKGASWLFSKSNITLTQGFVKTKKEKLFINLTCEYKVNIQN